MFVLIRPSSAACRRFRGVGQFGGSNRSTRNGHKVSTPSWRHNYGRPQSLELSLVNLVASMAASFPPSASSAPKTTGASSSAPPTVAIDFASFPFIATSHHIPNSPGLLSYAHRQLFCSSAHILINSCQTHISTAAIDRPRDTTLVRCISIRSSATPPSSFPPRPRTVRPHPC